MTVQQEQRLGLQLARLRDVSLAEVAIRFGFGAGASALAAAVAKLVDDRAGGLFLAFPAVLLASLTLIGKQEGQEDAAESDIGAVLGTAGMLAFAVAAAALFLRLPAVLVLLLATVVWFVAAFAAYAGQRAVQRRRGG